MQRKVAGLRAILRRDRLSMRDLAKDAGIPESTLHYWASSGVIPKKHRAQLARVIGCEEHELAPAYEQRPIIQDHIMVYEEMDRFFTFGRLKTNEIILDGDGEGVYLPEHIHAHYYPVAESLPQEFQERKERIAREQEKREEQGNSDQWNGERYNLVKFNISRDPANEDMTLGLWFRPSDYYTFLATSAAVQEPEIRKKYLEDVEWDEAIPLFAHSFSVLLTVLTSDGQTILVKRGKGLGCRPNTYDVSVAEGLSRSMDRSTISQAPDIHRCAARGLAEELGLHAPADFSLSDIQLTTFAVDTEYAMWSLFGLVKVERRLEEVLEAMRRRARDKFEQQRIFHMPFTPEEVVAFVFEHQPFSPGGLVCLYHALVHEYGHEKVDSILATF